MQPRRSALRMIRQHDHALLSGALAAAWREPHGGGLPWRLVLAIAVHDIVWRDEDVTPSLDGERHAPHDFTTLPTPRKRRLVREGIERLVAVDPDLALLVEEHHETLAADAPGRPSPDLAWLRFFDNLSLWICLTAPGSLRRGRPPWLADMPLSPPGRAPLTPSWAGEGVRIGGGLAPPAVLRLTVPYRDLPAVPYRSRTELRAAWDASPELEWTVALLPPGSPLPPV